MNHNAPHAPHSLEGATKASRGALTLLLALALLAAPLAMPVAARPGAAAADNVEMSAWAWGSNDDGQIGDGSPRRYTRPVAARDSAGIDRLGRIAAVAASDGNCWGHCDSRRGHSLALDLDGVVWEWGIAPNEPDAALRPFPQPVRVAAGGPALGGIAGIAAGGGFSLALDRQGQVWTWGANILTGGGPRSPWPQRVPGAGGAGVLGNIVAIGAGAGHALAVDRGGRVWTWGWRSGAEGPTLPALVRDATGASLGDIVAVAGSAVHSLALDRAGRLWAWGTNGEGELGDGTREPRPLPVRVLNEVRTGPLDRIVAIDAGGRSSLALDADGHVWTIGLTTTRVPDAAGTGLLSDIVGISRGFLSGLAVDRAGRAWQLSGKMPELVPDSTGSGPLRDVVAVADGMYHALAVDRSGQVWGWGSNEVGQLGAATPPFYSRPALVRSAGDAVLDAPVGVAAGYRRSLALDGAGRVWEWGNSSQESWFGGPRSPALVPRRDTGAPLDRIVAVAGGLAHGLALDTGGTIWAWGSDAAGQLGDGPGSPDMCAAYSQWECAIAAVPVPGLPPVAAIAAGGYHALALDRSGRVWAWGSNYAGALGTGDTNRRESPARVPGLATIVAVAAGGAHSLALAADGTVWAWGMTMPVGWATAPWRARRAGPSRARWSRLAVGSWPMSSPSRAEAATSWR